MAKRKTSARKRASPRRAESRAAPRAAAKKKGDCCPGWFPWLFLLAGLLLFAKDLGWGDWTMGLNWYTMVILLLGLKWVAMASK